MDLQVKLRGQRIELGEIEHALRSQPGVVGAVVQLCPSVADEHALVAYVHPPSVLAEQGQVLFNTHTTEAVPLELVERLRGLRTVLPAYMMPSVVIGVEHWPRTSSDKIDRTALRSPSLLKQAADATNAATKLVNPSTQQQRMPLSSHATTGTRPVLNALCKHLSASLSLPLGPDLDTPLMQMGVNSLQAVVLVRSCAEHAKAPLPATLAFDHPTVRLLAGAIEEAAASCTCSSSVELCPTASVRIEGLQAMALSGLSTHTPFGKEHFATMGSRALSNATNALGQVPASRWAMPAAAQAMCLPTESHVRGVHGRRVRHGGFTRGVQLFGASKFGILPAEAKSMDPQQRLLLEHGYGALHAASLSSGALDGSLVGVFAGVMAFEFAAMLLSSLPIGGSAYAATGSEASIASGRLSYVLGLHGPCVSYDTACSAALVASHAALRALQLAECTTGVASGVNLMLMPHGASSLAAAGMTSERGRCHTFDTLADGYARSEACAAATLMGPQAVRRDAHLGSAAVRQDGRSASLTAPNGKAQQALVIAALSELSLPRASPALNEAHGTGTALGDPIEVGSRVSAAQATRSHLPCVAPLLLGGAKANLGHAEHAAGAIGMLVLVGCSRCLAAAPNAQLRALNVHVEAAHGDWSSVAMPFNPSPLQARPETVDAGVSSFGYSGTIVHAILTTSVRADFIEGCNDMSSCAISSVSARRPLAFRRHRFPWRPDEAPLAPSAAGRGTTIAGVLYRMDWLCVRSFAAAAQEHRVLVLGMRTGRLAGTSFGHPSALPLDLKCEHANLPHALVLHASPRAVGFTGDLAELPIVELALAASQAFAEGKSGMAIPMWICTRGAQACTPSSATQGCASAGVWGLARACRAEKPSLMLACADFSGSTQPAVSLAGTGKVTLPAGSVRGLQTNASNEPEAAYVRQSFHVPRLQHVADEREFQTHHAIAFEGLRHALDAYTAAEAAKLDLDKLSSAQAALWKLCEEYTHAALLALDGADMLPLWYHCLLRGSYCQHHDAVQDSSLHLTARDALAAYPEVTAEVRLAEQCGPQLAVVLRGERAYQDVLFPKGSMDAVRAVYEESALSAFYNRCVVAGAEAIVSLHQRMGLRGRPAAPPMAVLEVGAGTGGTASSLVPILNRATCSRYVFTDVSQSFLRSARVRFAGHAFLEYALLNIDADPSLQGFASGSCDVVVATNCLHATPFVKTALRHCRCLLRSGGLLLANEALSTDPFMQMTFGMTDGWWFFRESRDPERAEQDSPLLDWRQWEALLAQTGFSDSHCMRGASALRANAVVLAQASMQDSGLSRNNSMRSVGLRGGTHIITGGLGGLGMASARLVASETSPATLVLLSRTGRLHQQDKMQWKEANSLHATCVCLRGDVADSVDVARALRVPKSGVWRGFMHLASIFASETFEAVRGRALQLMYGPKVKGAEHMHLAASCAAVGYFWLCGSAASLMDLYSRFQAPYAAANSCLTTLSPCRRSRGLRSISISWGAISDLHGSDERRAADDTLAAARFAELSAAHGLQMIPRPLACAVIAHALAGSVVCSNDLTVLDADWGKLTPSVSGGFLASVASRAGDLSAPCTFSTITPHQLAVSRPHLHAVLEMVRHMVGAGVDADTPLMEAGVDSLAAIELRTELQHSLASGRSLPATLVMDYPTVRHLCLSFEPQDSEITRFVGRKGDSKVRVAIQGMSTLLPAGASSLGSLRLQSMNGDDAIRVAPKARSQSGCGAGAGFLAEIALFDHVCFRISLAEAALMDPLQRLHLSTAYEALYEAKKASGQPPQMASHDTGLFVGVDKTEYEIILTELPAGGHEVTSSGLAIIAGRVSYALSLQGPCVANNCACTSALVAAHAALASVAHGDCSSALASGVNLLLIPSTTEAFMRAGMLSQQGCCFTFDARANGMGRGEASSSIALQEACVTAQSECFDALWASGAAVRQDGRSASLTAPNGPAQQLLFLSALTDGGVSASSVSWFESHGTGTKLGDPIESGSCQAVLLANVERNTALQLGSLKATTGHTEGASGLPGLLRTAIVLEQHEAPPNAQLRAVNPHVLASLRGDDEAWARGTSVLLPSQAGSMGPSTSSPVGIVNSFGLMGTIASFVIAVERTVDSCRSRRLLEPSTARSGLRRRSFPMVQPAQRPTVVDKRSNSWYACSWASPSRQEIDAGQVLNMGPRCLLLQHLHGLSAGQKGASGTSPSPPPSMVAIVQESRDAVAARFVSHAAILISRLSARSERECRVALMSSSMQSQNAMSGSITASNVPGGGLWGLGRAVRLECTSLNAVNADVTCGPRMTLMARWLADNVAYGQESEVAWSSGGSRLFARLRRCERRPDASEVSTYTSVVVTGGLGGLGMRAATLLVSAGAGRIWLGSRSGQVLRAGQHLEEQLLRIQRSVVIVCYDASSTADATALGQMAPTVGGILHAAGAADAGLLNEVTTAGLQWMHASKAVGASHLRAVHAALPLAVRVLFSSVGSGLANVGQSSYASANACLDAEAISQRSLGRVSLSLQWPMVGGAGMGAAGFAVLSSRGLSMVGMAGIDLEQYATCLSVQLSMTHSVGVSTQMVHRAALRELLSDLSDPTQPRFGELFSMEAKEGEWTSQASAAGVAGPFDTLAHAELVVLRVVRELSIIGELSELDVETPLMQAGIDSLATTELSSRLRALAGVALSPTLVFEHPTPRSVAAYLINQLAGSGAPVAAASPDASKAGVTSSELAVSATGGRWPGGCDRAEDRSQLQHACGDAVGSVPSTRWVLEETRAQSAMVVQCALHGGFLHGAQRFDRMAFALSASEASATDPQQRLLLELGYDALHRASGRRASMSGSDAGVFLGIERSDWTSAAPPSARASVHAVTGDNVSVASGRLSFALDLQGPCCSIDTACSSALVAVHGASSALRLGESARALGLGASLKLSPQGTLGAASAGMLSVDGRCKTVDRRANGFVRSEGMSSLVLVLAGSADVELSGLSGSAVRQDGRSASLTAPNGSAQRKLLLVALGHGGAMAGEAGCIEAHGTGTALGDPTEVGALVSVHGTRRVKLGFGAAKASVGHSEAASGGTGLLRAEHLLSARLCAGVAQLRVLSPLVGERASGYAPLLMMTTQGGQWASRARSICGVSSFGYSGTIAHAMLLSSLLLRSPQHSRLLSFRRSAFFWHVDRGARHLTATFAVCWAFDAWPRRCDATPFVLLRSVGGGSHRAPSSATRLLKHRPITLAAISLGCDHSSLSVLPSIQALLPQTKRLLILTHQSQSMAPLRSGPVASMASKGGAWGAARVARLEYCSNDVLSVDVASRGASHAGAVQLVLHISATVIDEAEVGFVRDSTRCVGRIRRSGLSSSISMRPQSALQVRSCAVTGGLGGLGMRAAALLVSAGAGRIWLGSRSGQVLRAGQHLEEQLLRIQRSVVIVCYDASSTADATALGQMAPTVGGILHAAGAADAGLLNEVTTAGLQWMHASKAVGASHLRAVHAALPLAVRVLFSV